MSANLSKKQFQDFIEIFQRLQLIATSIVTEVDNDLVLVNFIAYFQRI